MLVALIGLLLLGHLVPLCEELEPFSAHFQEPMKQASKQKTQNMAQADGEHRER